MFCARSGTNARMIMGKPDTIQVPAILTRIAYLKDKGLSLGFSTQEISDEEKVVVSRFHNEFGYLLFKKNEFKDEDIPQNNAPTDEQKTPSQRLRAVLFVLWKQQGQLGDFDTFYRAQVDRIIEKIKRALDINS